MHRVGIAKNVTVAASEVVSVARSFVGVKFLHQGRTRNGIDCIGLVLATMKELGVVTYEDIPTYARLPHGDTLLAPLMEYCTKAQAPEAGLVLAMRFRREVTHVGILAGSTIIHAYEGARKTVEHSYDKRWQSLTVGMWRLPGVLYE